jgi:hypothetical protein
LVTQVVARLGLDVEAAAEGVCSSAAQLGANGQGGLYSDGLLTREALPKFFHHGQANFTDFLVVIVEQLREHSTSTLNPPVNQRRERKFHFSVRRASNGTRVAIVCDSLVHIVVLCGDVFGRDSTHIFQNGIIHIHFRAFLLNHLTWRHNLVWLSMQQ